MPYSTLYSMQQYEVNSAPPLAAAFSICIVNVTACLMFTGYAVLLEMN